MSNPRFEQKMFIIHAGYGQQMDTLLALNPDLGSRFKREMTFDSLTGEQAAQLLIQTLNGKGFLDTSQIGVSIYETHQELCDPFTSMSQIDGWGDARDVHTISEDIARRVLLGSGEPDEPLSVTLDVVYEVLCNVTQRRGAHPPVSRPSFSN